LSQSAGKAILFEQSSIWRLHIAYSTLPSLTLLLRNSSASVKNSVSGAAETLTGNSNKERSMIFIYLLNLFFSYKILDQNQCHIFVTFPTLHSLLKESPDKNPG